MIKLTQGDILYADAEALVNTVNCVGVMGKGLAYLFKIKYHDNFIAYRDFCNKKHSGLYHGAGNRKKFRPPKQKEGMIV